jgi:D-serine dehydratase
MSAGQAGDARAREERLEIGPRFKGFPPGAAPVAVEALGALGWNALRGDLPLPLAVLKREALAQNERWMSAVIAAWPRACLCPHGKTTMSPALFRRQIEAGAWGITLSSAQQVRVARDFGIQRILLANPLVGRAELDYVLGEIARDARFDFYCLVDSEALVERYAAAHARVRPARPLQVLLELGIEGQRSGVRRDAQALELARRVRATPGLALCGVEGFEGLLRGADAADSARLVVAFADRIVACAEACERQGSFAAGEILLSAGGSAFYDLVLARLARFRSERPHRFVLRSGCYLTHDAGLYGRAFEALRARAGERLPRDTPEPVNALELLSWVLSRPEPGRAVLSFGKRDAALDDGAPRPLGWCRPGRDAGLVPFAPGERRIAAMNDQHAWLDLWADDPLEVGDVVACGVSHPCLTLDKWAWLPIVDQRYQVVGGVRTFF